MVKKSPATIPVDPSDVVVFSSLISCLEGGKFDADLTEALRGLLARMRLDHRASGGKPAGKISLNIGFRWEDGTVQTTQTFVVEPAVPRAPDRFFVSPDGALTQRPSQESIPLKAVAR